MKRQSLRCHCKRSEVMPEAPSRGGCTPLFGRTDSPWRTIQKLALLIVIFFLIFPIFCYGATDTSNEANWQEGYTLIIMKNTTIASSNKARDYVINRGGRIAILSPPHVMLGWVAPKLAKKIIGKYGIEYISYTPVDLTELKYQEDQTIAAVSFFNYVTSGALAGEMEASRGIEGEPLINDALEHPEINEEDYKKNLRKFGIAPSPRGNSDNMTGTVAVSLFFVESNGSIDPNLYTWTSTDQQNTYNRTVSGLSWWSGKAPSYGTSVSFTVSYYSATAPETQQAYEPILHTARSLVGEDYLWINQIMSNLGFNSGDEFARVTAFNTWLKGYTGTNWAYSVFIGYNPSPAPTTFTDGSSAYAYKGGPYSQMLFRNDYLVEENFGLALTHETGHIFWACDEYFFGCTSCGPCAPFGPRPNVLNGNCAPCNIYAVDCMMRNLTYALCSYTPLQIGWGGIDTITTTTTTSTTTTSTTTTTTTLVSTTTTTTASTTTTCPTYYRDADGDGYGSPSYRIKTCTPPQGYVSNNRDCNDNNANEHPDQTWYKDLDKDGYSNGMINTISCRRPGGYKTAGELTAISGDCNDSNVYIYPGSMEICDGKDNNCDGIVDLDCKVLNCPTCPKLCSSPGSLVFILKVGQTACKTLYIWNCGKVTLQWEVNETCSWLTLQPASGDDYALGERDQVSVCVDTSGLNLGKYNCTIYVSSDGGYKPIPVWLIIVR